MNAHALLTSQGWRGTGNSLHPTSNSIGLSKPLLVARKDDNHGIGKKHRTSDMWWMNAFDKTLQGLDTSDEGKVIQKITNEGLDVVKRGGGKWVLEKGGLYANFIKGEGLAGSLSQFEEGIHKAKKRKRESSESESKADRKARKSAKRALKEQIKNEKRTIIRIHDQPKTPLSQNLLNRDEEIPRETAEPEEHLEISDEKKRKRRREHVHKALDGETDHSSGRAKKKKEKKKKKSEHL